MIPNAQRILVLAPHTDDGEFGCGATINKFIELGADVYYAAFSTCEQSVLAHFPKDILVTEVKEATKVLGIKPDNLILYKYPVRTFSYQRQEILEDILLLKKDIQPDLILTPSVNDIHQDHSTVSNEAVRAFKFSTILCYELPWNNFNFATACFSKLENRHLDAKIAALKVYKSQAHRSFVDEDFMRSLARTRGVQMGAHYAEAFEVIRWLF